jgi:hypothetical protein
MHLTSTENTRSLSQIDQNVELEADELAKHYGFISITITH